MKKIGLRNMLMALFLMSTLIGVSGTYRISVRNQILAFERATDYYSVIRDLSPDQKREFMTDVNTNYVFNSLAKKPESDLYKKIDDEFFATIIDNRGYVQIGNNIYKLNTNDGVVYVIPSSNPELIADLDAGILTNPLIKTYLMTDEVVGMVEANVPPADSRLFCGESGAGWKTHEKTISLTNPQDNTECNDMYSRVRYMALGVYFSLTAHCQNRCPSRRMYYHKTPVAYKVKCGYTYGPIYQWDIDSGGNGSAAWNWTDHYYYNVQPLNGFWVRVVFMAKDALWIGNPDNPSADLEIRTNM